MSVLTPRDTNAEMKVPQKLLVLTPRHCLPARPIDSPKSSPRSTRVRKLRARKFTKATLAQSAVLAELPKPTAALARSGSLGSIDVDRACDSPPRPLPATMKQRARSAPLSRPATAERPCSLLGASLRASGSALLRPNAQPAAVVAKAARSFFDKTTGKTIHLRC
jgi:hypothetical protein